MSTARPIGRRWYEDDRPIGERARVLFEVFGHDYVEVDVKWQQTFATAFITPKQAEEMRDWLNQYLDWKKAQT